VLTGGSVAQIWNTETGQLIAQLEEQSLMVLSAAFSPDGQRIVTANADGTARIFRLVTLDEISRLLASK